jgi:hypothetical protein
MKPQHQLMLRKLGMGKGFLKQKKEARTMDEMPRDMKMLETKLETKMEGMGIKKRKPLKFKL